MHFIGFVIASYRVTSWWLVVVTSRFISKFIVIIMPINSRLLDWFSSAYLLIVHIFVLAWVFVFVLFVYELKIFIPLVAVEP